MQKEEWKKLELESPNAWSDPSGSRLAGWRGSCAGGSCSFGSTAIRSLFLTPGLRHGKEKLDHCNVARSLANLVWLHHEIGLTTAPRRPSVISLRLWRWSGRTPVSGSIVSRQVIC